MSLAVGAGFAGEGLTLEAVSAGGFQCEGVWCGAVEGVRCEGVKGVWCGAVEGVWCEGVERGGVFSAGVYLCNSHLEAEGSCG